MYIRIPTRWWLGCVVAQISAFARDLMIDDQDGGRGKKVDDLYELEKREQLKVYDYYK